MTPSHGPWTGPDWKTHLLTESEGPVTDYGATIVHWMRHRKPRYMGSYSGEAERPSISYIVDVSTQNPLKRAEQPSNLAI
jgi:hypothetical protein